MSVNVSIKKVGSNWIAIYYSAPHHNTPSILMIYRSVPVRIFVRPIMTVMSVELFIAVEFIFIWEKYISKENLSKTLNDIKLSVYSLHELSRKLNLRSISISKTSKINHMAWEDIKLIFDFVFANSLTKIIICNSINAISDKGTKITINWRSTLLSIRRP